MKMDIMNHSDNLSLGLGLLTPYQINKEIIINENNMMLDAWCNGGAISRREVYRPQNPNYGDKYIVPTYSTEDFIEAKKWSLWPTDNVGSIALYANKWYYVKPKEGVILWVVDEGVLCVRHNEDWHILVGSHGAVNFK